MIAPTLPASMSLSRRWIEGAFFLPIQAGVRVRYLVGKVQKDIESSRLMCYNGKEREVLVAFPSIHWCPIIQNVGKESNHEARLDYM
jgi:hypothetical protein